MTLAMTLASRNIGWMILTVCVSTLLMLTAVALERVLLLHRGTSLRWTWVIAIALSIGCSVRLLVPVSPSGVGAEHVFVTNVERAIEPIADASAVRVNASATKTTPTVFVRVVTWWEQVAVLPTATPAVERVGRMVWLHVDRADLAAVERGAVDYVEAPQSCH